jgi:tRNA threonylcarbamoyladenosine biosynthesis protein TsaE
MLELRSASVADTRAIAAVLSDLFAPGDVVVLAGEMGAGKTAFAQGVGAGLGVLDPVTSPTFTLVHRYDGGRLVMHHADVYRLDTMHELDDLGLDELGGVVVVEWGDVVASRLGDHLLVTLRRDDGDSDDEDSDSDNDDLRRLVLSGVGPTWSRRWDRLCSAVAAWSC